MRNSLKNSAFFIICLLFGMRAFAQIDEPKDNLKNVKILDIYLYKVFDVETKKNVVTFFKKEQTIAHTMYQYDKKGNEILQSYYHPATGKVKESFVYEYDSNNRKTQEIYVLDGRTLGGKTIYSYDKQGRKERTVVYNEKEEAKDRKIFEYDSIGNLIAEKNQNFSGVVFKEIRYKYDERNNLIEKRNIKTFWKKDNDPYFEIYSYNESNLLISKAHYNDKDSLTWKYTAKYDAKKRLIEEETKDGKWKVTSYATYTYNKKGQLSSSYNFDIPKKVPPMRIVYKYDKNGLNILRDIYVQDAKTPTITKRYYYDENGNWYRWWEVNHTNNTQAIANRKITYF